MRNGFLLLLLAALTAMPPAHAAGYDATVAFARRVELGVPVSGVVKTVAVSPGDRATEGQVLLALDDTPFKADFEQARADRDEAVRDYKQAKQLYDRTVLSTVELENARLKSVRAQARFTQAQYLLAQSRITAPFDAWILEVRAQPGQSIVSSLDAKPLLVLAAQGEYLARARIAGSALEKFRIGRDAKVSVAGKSFAGKVQSLALEPLAGKDGDGMHEVAVVFQAPGVVLRVGSPATLELP